MYKVLAIVLLLFTHMNTEVTMALRSAATGNRPAAAATTRPATQNVPAWLQGAYSQGNGNGGNGGGNTPEPARGTYRTGNAGTSTLTDVLKNKSNVINRTANRDDVYNGPNFAAPSNANYNPTRPAWMSNFLQTMQNNAQGGGAFNYGNRDAVQSNQGQYPNAPAPQTGYGQTNPNPDVTQGHLRGTNQPFVIGQDSITQVPGSPYDSYAGYRFPQLQLAVSGRSFGNEIGAGTLDPTLWDQAAGVGSGFGSSYGGNWKGKGRGGGGGGGGGWGSGYNNADSYPAWMKLAMGLNSWNIK